MPANASVLKKLAGYAGIGAIYAIRIPLCLIGLPLTLVGGGMFATGLGCGMGNVALSQTQDLIRLDMNTEKQSGDGN